MVYLNKHNESNSSQMSKAQNKRKLKVRKRANFQRKQTILAKKSSDLWEDDIENKIAEPSLAGSKKSDSNLLGENSNDYKFDSKITNTFMKFQRAKSLKHESKVVTKSTIFQLLLLKIGGRISVIIKDLEEKCNSLNTKYVKKRTNLKTKEFDQEYIRFQKKHQKGKKGIFRSNKRLVDDKRDVEEKKEMQFMDQHRQRYKNAIKSRNHLKLHSHSENNAKSNSQLQHGVECIMITPDVSTFQYKSMMRSFIINHPKEIQDIKEKVANHLHHSSWVEKKRKLGLNCDDSGEYLDNHSSYK